jgi:hypothetical protein
MTTNQSNEQGQRATVEPIDIDAALARLILLRKMHNLPRPTDYNIYYGDENNSTDTINIRVAAAGEVALWADALGISATGRRSSVHSDAEWHNAWNSCWHGWFITVQTKVDIAITTVEMDADTVAGLEEIAAPAADEQESTSVRCENTDESRCCRCRLPVDHLGGCRFVRLDRDEAVSA